MKSFPNLFIVIISKSVEILWIISLFLKLYLFGLVNELSVYSREDVSFLMPNIVQILFCQEIMSISRENVENGIKNS